MPDRPLIATESATKKMSFFIYISYLLSLPFPFLPLIAVIFAYIFENDAKGILKSHYQYLIRSFWLGLIYFGLASILTIVLIGFALIGLCYIWWIIRMAKGLKSLMRNEAINNPKTWIF